jgi:hypothetical protein
MSRNLDQILAAESILDAYAHANLGEAMAETSEEPETILADLLTGLRHYCANCDVDFAAAVQASEFHFEEER